MFNRRHSRSGHLFQNRYKSIVCEEEPYLLELIRYIHLNPLRAGLVKDLKNLDRYPWCGHVTLLGKKVLAGQTVDEVLMFFGSKKKAARHAYMQFLSDGVAMGKRPELVGGGLRRSQLMESNGAVLGDYDERVLGGGDFVASLREDARLGGKLSLTIDLNSLQTRVIKYFELPSGDILRRGRRNHYSEARELFCYLAVRELGFSGVKVGEMIGMGISSVSRSVRRGEELFALRPVLREWWIMQLKQ
jgi:hypothetical protein